VYLALKRAFHLFLSHMPIAARVSFALWLATSVRYLLFPYQWQWLVHQHPVGTETLVLAIHTTANIALWYVVKCKSTVQPGQNSGQEKD
jgi:hypothetical protein